MAAVNKEKTSEFRRNGIATIRTTVNLYNVHKWYEDQLESLFDRAIEQMETALAVGKVMQDILLQYMSPQDLKKELNRRMLEIRTTVTDRKGTDAEQMLFTDLEGSKNGTSGIIAGPQEPQT